MYTRLLAKPLQARKSFFLFGPRGTGKTSWIKHNLPDAIYLDLPNTSLYTELLAQPNRLELTIPPGYQGWIVLDEVQKIPSLLNEVHRLIESKQYCFVLTGSSARSLRKKGSNLLAGRATVYHMHPLVLQEMGADFNLTRALEFGLLPAVSSEPDPKKYLAAYSNTYLREEVMEEGLTRNIAAFSRFLEVASFSQGSIVNMSAIARDTGVNQKSVVNYFDILEDLLIGFRLPVFTKRAKRDTVSHPKFYYFDCGVFMSIKPSGYLDRVEENQGAGSETLFLQHLRALNDYLELNLELAYWRLKTDTEVDFVVHGPKGLWAFEIKRTSSYQRKDTAGLRSFVKDYPEAKLYFVYGGEQEYYQDNVRIMPFVKALKELPRILSDEM